MNPYRKKSMGVRLGDLASQGILNSNLQQRWIGRGGVENNIPWLARLPDLTPMDFFSWGFIKSKVCHQYEINLRRVLGMFQEHP